MKPLLLSLLLLPLIGMGQKDTVLISTLDLHPIGRQVYYKIKADTLFAWNDTIPATIIVQYTRRDALTTREVYLINGEPWYRSTAAFTKGKWIKPKWYRWKIW